MFPRKYSLENGISEPFKTNDSAEILERLTELAEKPEYARAQDVGDHQALITLVIRNKTKNEETPFQGVAVDIKRAFRTADSRASGGIPKAGSPPLGADIIHMIACIQDKM